MANFGSYEGHRIMSQAMDNAIQEQRLRDRQKHEIKKMEADAALNKIKTEQYKKQIERDDLQRQREKLLSDFAKRAYTSRQGLGALYIPDPNNPGQMIQNPNSDLLIDAYTQAYDKGSLIDADTNNILRAQDLIDVEKYLNPLSKEDFTQMRRIYASLDENEQENFRNKHGKQVTDMRIITGQDDAGVDLHDFLSSSSGTPDDTENMIKSAYQLDTFGGTQTFDSDEWGGNIEVSTFNNPSSTARSDAQTLLDAIANNKTSKKNNVSESDNVELIQVGPNEWKLTEDDFGPGWMSDDEYEVKVSGGKALIKIDGEWVDLNKADF